MALLHRFRHFLLPAGMTACLLVMLMPLPAALLDMLLVMNITVAVLMLLTALWVRSPLEFSVFPSLLLATTLVRLVLNVATTRLILARGREDGLLAAGAVVRSFGQFVASDTIVIGAVIFCIIIVIQFVVITQGASRIGEVAARFTLDGMPGKQMAIDADLSAGMIDQVEARRRREEIKREADFFGAMDGASKFVRGDAIAGMAITAVNMIGGLLVGVVQEGMSVSEAASLYTRLTIGDGLVSQVPAFLIALAAGVLITRSTSRTNLPEQAVDQLLVRPEALATAAIFLSVLALTGLPMIPLLLSAAACGLFAWQGGAKVDPPIEEAAPRAPKPQPKVEKRVEDFLHVDPLELEIGVGLLRLADPRRGGDLLDRISALRQRVASDLGIVLPKVRIRDNLGLEDHEYRIKIANTPVASGACYTGRWLASDPGNVVEAVQGIPCRIGAMGPHAVWVDGAGAAEAEELGYRLIDPADVLLEHLRIVVHQFADELMGRDATQHLLEELAKTQPTVVRELVPEVLRLGTVQQVLQQLLREGFSIRQLGTIVEALCDHARDTQDAHELTAHVRRRMGRNVSLALRDAKGVLAVVALDVDLQNVLRSWQQRSRGRSMNATDMALAADAIYRGCAELRMRNRPEVLLVPAELCTTVRMLTVDRLPFAHVIAPGEISPDTRLEVVHEVLALTLREHAA